jgi:hypothetical protein
VFSSDLSTTKASIKSISNRSRPLLQVY